MAIDLKQVIDFFKNFRERRMPKSVLGLILQDGFNLKYDNLETTVTEWRSLRDIFSPDIAAKIEVPTTGYNIPLLRLVGTPEHFVYHPHSGEYLGQFEVNPVVVSE